MERLVRGETENRQGIFAGKSVAVAAGDFS
jgi:hypothetical protein